MHFRVNEDSIKVSASTQSTKISTDTNKQPTFSMGTGDYISGRPDKHENRRDSRVETGSNPFIVALRVDGKEPSAWGYNRATLFRGRYKYRDLTLQVVGVSNLRQ
jgi:hypothetical protein